MVSGEEKTPSRLYEGGAGGKIRKPPTRKPPTTPYARPESSQLQRRWLSKLVDPAYRLISGGATRLFPVLFGKLPSGADGEDHDTDESNTELDQKADSAVDDCNLNNGTSRPSGVPVSSVDANTSNNNSNIDGIRVDNNNDLSNGIPVSEIENLMKGKSFSRDEVNRLIEIIQSRALEDQNVNQEKKRPLRILGAEPAVPMVALEIPRIPAEEKSVDFSKAVTAHEIPRTPAELKGVDFGKAMWGTSTSLQQFAPRDEVPASPVEIARAYMGRRTSEVGLPFKSMETRDERTLLAADDFASKPFIPSASPRSSACWPGSMAQDQRGYLTPQSQRGRFGLHNYPQTPYSRTIYSKSKTRLAQLPSDDDKFLKTSSPLWQQQRTPIYEQVKARNDVVDDAGRSVGPIRRSRPRSIAETSSRGSFYSKSSPFLRSEIESSALAKGTLSSMKKNFESSGRTSSISQFKSGENHSSQVGTPTVHPQSCQIARTILEHISRNPPTPKDKSEELKRAISWKKPLSSGVSSDVKLHEVNSLPLRGFDKKIENQVGHKEFTQSNASAADVGDAYMKLGDNAGPIIKSTNEDVLKTVPAFGSEVVNQQNKATHSSGTNKPASIHIDKPIIRWGFSSDNNSTGFTFPVSASSGRSSEPPTPSFVPLLSTTVQSSPSLNNSQNQQKAETAVPTFSFGSKRSTPAIVFSFPSTSSATIQDDASDIKFSFGSDSRTRISFSSIGKNAICY